MAPNLQTRSLTPEELRTEHALLRDIVRMINQAYHDREEEGSLPRFTDPSALLEELGDDGRCVVLQDAEHDAAPVAFAGAKRWKGREGWRQEEGREWEISPLATSVDTQYRKKGLVDRCLETLYGDLWKNAKEEEQVKVWVRVVEKYFASYWKNKGFEQVGEREIIPKGEWHRDQEYVLIDMCKTLPRP